MNNELTLSATADRLGVLLRLSRERTIRYNFRPETLKQLRAIEELENRKPRKEILVK